METKTRVTWIDIIKTIAIILIVGFHFAYEIEKNQSIRWIGFIGVSLFFIASGFMLSFKYPEIISFNIKWLKKRIIRIISVYYPALIMIVMLFGTQTYYKGFTDLISHFLFLNFLSHDTAYSIISPAWFFIPLIGLYFLFPYLNRLMKNNLFFILIMGITILNRLVENVWASFSPFFFIAEFCFGIGLAQKKDYFILLTSLFVSVVNPIMVIPYILFFILSYIKLNNKWLKLLFYTIGGNTFLIFLFHESVIKVILNEWSICHFGILLSLIILSVSIGITMFVSKLILQIFIPLNKVSATTEENG
ncbi:acyltransferase family protein [Candidatus Micrarchaeota archaeon]|nr:acyltransferase family protein [Candidatus Micrarchaeota archaeon]